MNVNIELDQDQLGAIIVSDLEDTLFYLEQALLQPQPNIFSVDAVTDKITIMKHIDAFKLVLDWYK